MTPQRSPIARAVNIAGICACFIASAALVSRAVPNYEAALWALIAGCMGYLHGEADDQCWKMIDICDALITLFERMKGGDANAEPRK